MKYTILALVVLVAFLFVACNKKVAEKTTEAVEVPEPVEEKTVSKTIEPPVAKPTEEANSKSMDKKPYAMLKYKKTPCYGKCPVYEVEVYTDGYMTWEGKNFVEKMGNYEARISEDEVKAIKQKFFDAKFLDMALEYPTDGQKISDLPSTIIDFRVGDMIKHVTNKHDAPQELNDLQKWVEAYFEELKWTKNDRD